MYNNIRFTEETCQYRFKFLNGEIVLPDKPGGYVMATGCGAGKTTCIRQIMLTKFNEGILYSAATKRECDEMYDYLIDECTKNNIEVIDQYGETFRLTPDKILNVHSEPRLVRDSNGNCICTNGINTSLWENHPEKVADFYIVICTHYKLLHENPYTLMRTNFNCMLSSVDLLTQAMRVRHTDDGLPDLYPRKWMLVDEQPTCEPLKMEWERSVLNGVCDSTTDIRTLGLNQYGEMMIESFKKYIPPYRYDLLKWNLIEAIKCTSSMKGVKFNGTKSDQLKFDLIASIIHHELPNFLRSKDPVMKVTYNLSKLVLDNGINTKLILFDGTGDLTHVNSKKFTILKYGNKYNSPINVVKFENHQPRVVKIDKSYSRKEDIINSLNKNVEELQRIIDENQRTLIVTWKNLKSDELRISKSMSGLLNDNENITKFILNDEFSLPEYYRNRLNIKDDKEVDIIHYQSGLDKATNEYRDFDTVVFLGEFHIPGYAVKEFNELYGCSTDLGNYTTYQLVQAICRTRIRKHRGESINVYFSNDWDNKVINKLLDYVSMDKVELPVIADKTFDHIKPKWRYAIETLSSFYPDFRTAIEKNYSFNLTIDLDDIYRILPTCDKKVKNYFPFINYLRKYLDIELTIDSKVGRKSTI